MPNLYILEIEIQGLPKRTNNNNGHWYLKKKEADKWKRLVELHTVGKRPERPLKKARVTMVRHSSVEPDFDGLVSSGKHLIDGLILAGIIENDKMSNIGQPVYGWEKTTRGKGRVCIKVEELREKNEDVLAEKTEDDYEFSGIHL